MLKPTRSLTVALLSHRHHHETVRAAGRHAGASGWNALDDGIGGGGGDDASEAPAGGGEQVAKFRCGAFAAAGEDEHLQVEELAGREVVAGVNNAVDDEEFAAGIDALAAGFEDLDAEVVGPIVMMCFMM